MKRWLYLHLTWQGREDRRMVREYDAERAGARAAWADSPVRTCPHERREPKPDVARHSDRYDYYDPERCLDCGTGIVKARRK